MARPSTSVHPEFSGPGRQYPISGSRGFPEVPQHWRKPSGAAPWSFNPEQDGHRVTSVGVARHERLRSIRWGSRGPGCGQHSSTRGWGHALRVTDSATAASSGAIGRCGGGGRQRRRRHGGDPGRDRARGARERGASCVPGHPGRAVRGRHVPLRLRVRRRQRPAGRRRHRPGPGALLLPDRHQAGWLRGLRHRRGAVRQSARRRGRRAGQHLHRRRREQPDPGVHQHRHLPVAEGWPGPGRREPEHPDRRHLGPPERRASRGFHQPEQDQGVERGRRLPVAVARPLRQGRRPRPRGRQRSSRREPRPRRQPLGDGVRPAPDQGVRGRRRRRLDRTPDPEVDPRQLHHGRRRQPDELPLQRRVLRRREHGFRLRHRQWPDPPLRHLRRPAGVAGPVGRPLRQPPAAVRGPARGQGQVQPPAPRRHRPHRQHLRRGLLGRRHRGVHSQRIVPAPDRGLRAPGPRLRRGLFRRRGLERPGLRDGPAEPPHPAVRGERCLHQPGRRARHPAGDVLLARGPDRRPHQRRGVGHGHPRRADREVHARPLTQWRHLLLPARQAQLPVQRRCRLVRCGVDR